MREHLTDAALLGDRWNSQLTCKGDGTTTISPKDQCGHPTWHSSKAFEGYWPQQGSLKGGLLYAEADADGLRFTKPELPIIPGIAYDTKQKKNVVFSNTSNILLQAYADPNRGVIYDIHDANASRRCKYTHRCMIYLEAFSFDAP